MGHKRSRRHMHSWYCSPLSLLLQGDKALCWASMTGGLTAFPLPGTVVLIHYDLWHAGLENYSTDPSRPRFMFKFQFVRMEVSRRRFSSCMRLCEYVVNRPTHFPPTQTGAHRAIMASGPWWAFSLASRAFPQQDSHSSLPRRLGLVPSSSWLVLIFSSVF